MGKRRPNPQLVKIHRNYTVGEIAETFDVHTNTVRQWIKHGLRAIDKYRPTLILGSDLREFLQFKRSKNKVTCKPGEIYCVRCRAAQKPDGNMADFKRLNDNQGNLIGICPTCSGMIYRVVSIVKLDQVRGQLDISILLAPLHINKSN